MERYATGGLVVIMLWMCLASARAQDADWPQYRGPNRDGISKESGWTTDWPADGPPVAWKTNVGVGYSCVSVHDGRLYTMGNTDDRDSVLCLDAADGRKLWEYTYDCKAGRNPGTRVTPTLDDGRVYTVSRDMQMFCLDALRGTVIWSQKLRETIGARPPYWGYASSPAVLGDMLLIQAGATDGTVAALNKTDGKLVWKGGKGIASYCMPTVYRRGGKTRLALLLGDGAVGLDAATGEQLWKFPVKAQWNITITDPIVVGDHVFISDGYGVGSYMLKLNGEQPEVVWSTPEFANMYTTSVLWKGHLYGIDGDNSRKPFLKCYDWATGEEKWSYKGLGRGSLMLADGKLIVQGESGELAIAEATPGGYTELARAKVLSGRCWTMPVLVGGRIYCRSHEGDLVCLDVRRN
jgi:outer membrane protein assembly factor BamB